MHVKYASKYENVTFFKCYFVSCFVEFVFLQNRFLTQNSSLEYSTSQESLTLTYYDMTCYINTRVDCTVLYITVHYSTW